LDFTHYTTIRETVIEAAEPSPTTFDNAVVICAKSPTTGLVFSCQAEPVGRTLLPTTACTRLGLGFPQAMDTVVVVAGVAKTVESQKEIFRCATPNGPVIQEVVIWTFTIDNSAAGTPSGSSASAYAVETCQKPVSLTRLPIMSCTVTGPVALNR
jgi:hypothetical protein